MGRGRIAPRIAGMLASVVAGTAAAQDPLSSVSGYITLASGYWKHGLAQRDGTSLQLGIDYQHHSGLFGYARAMNVDYPRDYYGRTGDFEASAYVGYHDRSERWSWTASLGRYFYPGTNSLSDYNEASFSAGFRDRVFYRASYNDEYHARAGAALDQEVSLVFPLRGDVELGGALGYFRVAAGGADITHWNVGISKLLGSMALDLRYYEGNYEWRSYLGDPAAQHYVLSMSYVLRRSRSRN